MKQQSNGKIFDEICPQELYHENTIGDGPKQALYEIESWSSFSKMNKECATNTKEDQSDVFQLKLSKNLECPAGYNEEVNLEEQTLKVLDHTTQLVTVETHISDNTSNSLDESANLPGDQMERNEHGDQMEQNEHGEVGNSDEVHTVSQTLDNPPTEATLEIKTIFPIQNQTDNDSRSFDQKCSDDTVQTSNDRKIEEDKSNVLSDAAGDIPSGFLWLTSNSLRDCWNMSSAGDAERTSRSRNNVPGHSSFFLKVFRMVFDVVSFIQYYSYTYVLKYILFI